MTPRLPSHRLILALALALTFSVLEPTWAGTDEPSRLLPKWQLPVNPATAPLNVFRAPLTPYSSGHRGVDYQVPDGTPIYAPAAGSVAFAGPVALKPVLVLQHSNGLLSAYEPACTNLAVGDEVEVGQLIGSACWLTTYRSHCEPQLCLHFSARRSGKYLSPQVFTGGLGGVGLLY